MIGLDLTVYGIHSMLRAKATLVYERTKTFALCKYDWHTENCRLLFDIKMLS
jgi:hypothetical protein